MTEEFKVIRRIATNLGLSCSDEDAKNYTWLFLRKIERKLKRILEYELVGNSNKCKVYAFQYTDCIYESAYATMSLHKTKLGAYRAMREYITKEWIERTKKQPYHGAEKWERCISMNDHPFKYNGYCVVEIEVEA